MRILRGFVADIRSDIRSGRFVTGMSIGIIAWLMAIIQQISYASMIFAGPLSPWFQRGVGGLLAGSAIMILIAAIGSGFPSIISLTQDGTAAIMAGIASGIYAGIGPGLQGVPDSSTFMSILAALAVSTASTGIFFIIVGKLRLAEFVRFLPYPVVAGFLAGTGFLLSKGSLEVMSGIQLDAEHLGLLFQAPTLLLWVPGTLFAVILLLLLKKSGSILVMPLALIGGVALYYLVLFVLGIDISEARAMGLAFAPFQKGGLWPSYSLKDLDAIRWDIVLDALPSMAVIPIVSILGLLLNSTGLESARKAEADMNRELVVVGSSNILGALCGAHAGYCSLSLSTLGVKARSESRFTGLVAAAGLGLILIMGGQLLAWFPKAILGGFLMLLGLFFIDDWLVKTHRKIPLTDYLIILGIFITVGIHGFMYGVIVGLILTILLFVARISRISLCKTPRSGTSDRSRKARSLPQHHLLSMHGDAISIFDLEGYIFFGSVSRLTAQIDTVAATQPSSFNEGSSIESSIILDFSAVTGFDISAISNVAKLVRRFAQRRIHLIFSQLPPHFQSLLINQVDTELQSRIMVFPDLDTGLAWAEDRLLHGLEQSLDSDTEQARQARGILLDSVSIEMMRALERRERVESLVGELEPWLESACAEAGTTILTRGDRAHGLYIVTRGSIAEVSGVHGGSSVRTRTLSSGELFAVEAIAGDWISPSSYLADSRVDYHILRYEAMLRMEKEKPETAVRVQRLVVDILTERTGTGSP